MQSDRAGWTAATMEAACGPTNFGRDMADDLDPGHMVRFCHEILPEMLIEACGAAASEADSSQASPSHLLSTCSSTRTCSDRHAEFALIVAG
jgi:hypothetical protein